MSRPFEWASYGGFSGSSPNQNAEPASKTRGQIKTVTQNDLCQTTFYQTYLLSDSKHQAEVADKLRELEALRSKVEELNKRKRELVQRLRHLPTGSLQAKLLENVKVGGKGIKFVLWVWKITFYFLHKMFQHLFYLLKCKERCVCLCVCMLMCVSEWIRVILFCSVDGGCSHRGAKEAVGVCVSRPEVYGNHSPNHRQQLYQNTIWDFIQRSATY